MSPPRSEGAPAPARVALADLLERYDGLLIDSYGVLVDGRGALPGAAALIAELERRGARYLIVTNDASRRPGTAAARYRRFGIEVAAGHFLGSGDLIAPHFAARGLTGARCLVLGTDDSRQLVAEAGGQVCAIDPAADYDAVVVCDDDGFPFLEGINAALSALFRAFDAGRAVELVLPNPDIIYPAGDGAFGFTSGAIGVLLEAALARRYPLAPPRFTRLGKPHRPLYDEAVRRLGSARPLMIGDQLETDIAGALACGIDAALLVTGVTRWQDASAAAGVVPTYLLESLA
ncbi:MAG TPA: HAD-IIA family hydrolase [Kofleriaceae bacterium]|nr:HAD-IIA family hydrolase [Kofleriaceae bacterium]